MGAPVREREYRKEPRFAIDLNFDGGEGYDDAGLMRQASTVNIACGAHAGDAPSMLRAVRLAQRFSAAINAHPSYPDREGFGRTRMTLSPEETESTVYMQVATLYEIARSEETQIVGVKPHGGLYHAASGDRDVAGAVARAVRRVSSDLVVVGAPGSLLLEAAEELGLVAAREGFADRGYLADGSLVPRSEAGAVIVDPAAAARQAVSLVCQGSVSSRDGSILRMAVDTLCIHGDTPDAPAIAAAVRSALLAAKVVIRSLKGWSGGARGGSAPGRSIH